MSMATRPPRAVMPLLLALLATTAAPACAQQPTLGRLFASPAERSLLDQQRAAGPAAAPAMPGTAAPTAPGMMDGANPQAMANAAAPSMTAAPLAPASSSVQLSGVLRGSSGRTTVWLNQVPQTGGATAGPGQAVSLRLSSGRQLILKPGQRYDPDHGSVQEVGH